MYRLVLTAIAGLTVVLLATPAFAFQCPKLVAQLQTATANRFDPAAANAKQKAAQAQALHAGGKHAESEKLAKETLASLGIK